MHVVSYELHESYWRAAQQVTFHTRVTRSGRDGSKPLQNHGNAHNPPARETGSGRAIPVPWTKGGVTYLWGNLLVPTSSLLEGNLREKLSAVAVNIDPIHISAPWHFSFLFALAYLEAGTHPLRQGHLLSCEKRGVWGLRGVRKSGRRGVLTRRSSSRDNPIACGHGSSPRSTSSVCW